AAPSGRHLLRRLGRQSGGGARRRRGVAGDRQRPRSHRRADRGGAARAVMTAILLRTTAVLLCGLGVRAVLRGSAAALRHLVAALSLFGAVLVVPASLLLPSWTLRMPVAAAMRVDTPPDRQAPTGTVMAVASARVAEAPRRALAPAAWTA